MNVLSFRHRPAESPAPVRSRPAENPHLSARRTWNGYLASETASRQFWQCVAGLSLLIALALVGGMIHLASQSRFIPIRVDVDRLGRVAAVGPVPQAQAPDPLVIRQAVSEFIEHARMVTPDVALQRRAVFKVYSMLASGDPSTQKMTEWMNGSEESSPVERATKIMVSVQIQSVLHQTESTWQVDWLETTRDRQGALLSAAVPMRALVTVYWAAPTAQTSEEEMYANPLGIFVRDFSWSRAMEG